MLMPTQHTGGIITACCVLGEPAAGCHTTHGTPGRLAAPLPIATPRLISMRFLTANTTALACSAALPTRGTTMVVRKGMGTRSCLLASAAHNHTSTHAPVVAERLSACLAQCHYSSNIPQTAMLHTQYSSDDKPVNQCRCIAFALKLQRASVVASHASPWPRP